MSEGIRVFPERLNPEGEEFKGAIEALSRPPERELSEEDRFEVTSFEHALANGEVPFGLPLADRVPEPKKTMADLYAMEVLTDEYCVDYYLQPEVYDEVFPEGAGLSEEEKPEYVKRELARRIASDEERPSIEHLGGSAVYVQDILQQNLLQLFETGQYDHDADPEIERGIRDPELLIEKAEGVRSLRRYYREIEKQLVGVGSGENTELKSLALKTHQEQANQIMASCYRDAMSLIRQNRNADILTTQQQGSLQQALPALRMRIGRDMTREAGFVDRESMAGFLDRIDKFIYGVDHERSTSHVSSALQDLRENYEFQEGSTRLDYRYADVDPELLESRKVNAEELKHMLEMVLTEYGLLSEHTEYDPDSTERAEDNKWRVVIDPKKSRKSLGVDDVKRCVMVPQKFKRTLGQTSPSGVLPLIDHEITHVLQHENGNRLGLEIFQSTGAARAGLWFETGGVVWERAAQDELFGKDKRTNFTYLAALERRLEGGTIPECALEYLQEARKVNPSGEVKKQAGVALRTTLRLFRNNGELAIGTNYATNTAPLAYAEQRILADAIPEDKRWLFYVGKVNLNVLAGLYRQGWFKQNDFLIPERLPSDIVEDYVRTQILD